MPKHTKHIAVYIRVSTRQQSTKSQEPDLKRWLELNADDQPYKLYKDKASGKSMQRPGWKKMEDAIASGKVSMILVWRIDRLGRTVSGLAQLFEVLQKRKINLVSLKDSVDLSTSAGRLMANVIASMAQYETELRAERVLAGQAVAKENGKTWGGSKAGKRKVVTREQIESIKHLHSKEVPIARIARTVGLTRPTIYSVLND